MNLTIPSRQKCRQYFRQEIKPLLILVLVMCAVRSAVADWNDVPTGSMKPTIMEGDRVVFFSPADGIRLVKRVIGLPGDRIELVNNQLLVNGAPVHYDALPSQTIAELPVAEQPQHQFATEDLATHPHP